MARPLRIEYEGAFYHVISRRNLRGDIFFDDKDKERFLEILNKLMLQENSKGMLKNLRASF